MGYVEGMAQGTIWRDGMKDKQRVYISGAMSGVARERYLARFDMA